MRPMEILTTWTCEELLVAYGVYANAKSKESYDMMTKADRRKHGLTWLDRWAIPFFDAESMQKLSDLAEENKIAQQEAEEMAAIADALFS